MNITSQERQFVYSWLSSLLGQELSASQLQAYHQGVFESLLNLLSEQGYAPQIQQLNNVLAQLKVMNQPHLELAADFAQLFLLEGNTSALPYASAYLTGEALSQNLTQMDAWLNHFQLGINRVKNEPSDHLCVYLEVLGRLIEQQSIEQQQRFIREQLLSWLPQFLEKLVTISSQTQFYQIVLSLLIAVLTDDLA